MNFPILRASRRALHASRRYQGRSGSAVIVVLALLAIMLVYVAANTKTLYHLSRELKLVERHQIHRLEKAALATNAPPAITVVTNAAPKDPTR